MEIRLSVDCPGAGVCGSDPLGLSASASLPSGLELASAACDLFVLFPGD